MPALGFKSLGADHPGPSQAAWIAQVQAGLFCQFTHSRCQRGFSGRQAPGGQVVQQAGVGGFVVGAAAAPQVPLRQKAVDVHRMAHHAQVPETGPLYTQKWGHVQSWWPGGCVRPPRKKLTTPTGESPLGRLLLQKSLQSLAALHGLDRARLPVQTTLPDGAAGQQSHHVLGAVGRHPAQLNAVAQPDAAAAGHGLLGLQLACQPSLLRLTQA